MANSQNGVDDDSGEAGQIPLTERLLELIARAGQSSVLRFWDQLPPEQRAAFAQQLASVDWSEITRRRNRCLYPAGESKQPIGRIEPPRRTIRRPVTPSDWSEWEAASHQGQQMLRRGEVGVLMVAGGSGTRLGFDHPKGMFPIGPVTNRSLYQLFAEQVLALSRRHGISIPFLIMTGQATHEETVEWFQRHHCFGLDPADVFFFQQGWQPALDANTGELLLAGKFELATSADGHGGVLDALLAAHLFDELRRRGIKTLFYHQVDNPLVHICEPSFLGFHARVGAQVSTKVVCKCSPEEKVGVVVEIDGRSQIIEYIDLPGDMANAREPDGQLLLRAGNTAIHLFQCDFLEQVATRPGGLPWHQVRRVVPCVDSTGQVVSPDRPNGLKFERFIFDVLPIAQTALVVEIDRATEFAPLKNAEGESSPAEVRQAMTSVARDKLRSAGIEVPDGTDVEISPLAILPGDEPVVRPDVSLPIGAPWVLGAEHLAPRRSGQSTCEAAKSQTAPEQLGPLRFESKLVPRVWGGRALGDVLGHSLPTDEPFGEAWDVSTVPDGVSLVAHGPHRGKSLAELWMNHAAELRGTRSQAPADFPLLIKWLECRERLSLQVHPDDAMARQVLQQPYGKSEVWIVLRAESSARVMAGLRPGVSRDDFLRHLHAGTLEECIHCFTPRAGDCIPIPAGTIHAAGGGLLIAEVQQSSDATFRLHDWNRMGLDGRPRPLQIDLALQAIDWAQGPVQPVVPRVASFDLEGLHEESLTELHAFSLKRYTITRPWIAAHAGELTIWMVLDGTAVLTHARTGDRQIIPCGRTVVLPASAGEVTWSPIQDAPSATLLCVRIPN